jgi:hypothetical protein
MMNLQPFCDFCDSWPDSHRQSLDCQQKLVLAWLKTSIASGALAEAQETAYLVSELG